MNDLTQEYISDLRNYKIANLDLGNDALHPHYEKQSLLNVPSSLCDWLGAPRLPHPSLGISQLNNLAEGIQQLIVVLIDAISHRRFQDWIDRLDAESRSVFQDAYLVPLTSIAPSTTSTVLTTLWTGLSPAEHGILGYELFLKEYGLVANMITHSPASFEGRPGLLYHAGFQPESAIPAPTLGSHLSQAGVETFVLLSHTILGSGLSRMHYPSSNAYGFGTLTDLWIQTRHLAEMKITVPRLIWIYYGMVDTYSHVHGPDSEQAESEFISFLNIMSKIFLSRFQGNTRPKTLLMILSDHGQIHTPKNDQYNLSNHPGLLDNLHIPPTGESRLTYLYPRPGQVEVVQEHIEHTWPGRFHILPSGYALKNGLFGPGEPLKESWSRIGDLLIISQQDAYFWWSKKPNPLLGRHGGFSEDEMIVPLLMLRLD